MNEANRSRALSRRTVPVLAAAGVVVAAAVIALVVVKPLRHRFAALGLLQARVEVRPTASRAYTVGIDRQSLAVGAGVRTADPGFASINYFDGSLTRLGPATQFTVTRLTSRAGTRHIRARLDVGSTWQRVKKLSGSDTFEIDTPSATAGVRGTTFVVRCLADRSCEFTDLEGRVLVTTRSGQRILLSPSQRLTVSPQGRAGAAVAVGAAALAADPFVALNRSLDAGATFSSTTTSTTAATTTTTTAPRPKALIVVSGKPMKTVDPDTGAVHQLAISGDNPAWSPDRSHLAYDRNNDIFVANANGTGEHAVVSGAPQDTDPSWSPDGLSIAFARDAASIQVVHADGSGLHQVAVAPPPDSSDPPNAGQQAPPAVGDVAWSPDGGRIAFTVDYFRPRLSFVTPTGGAVQRTNDQVYSPDWSPDGAQMATGTRGNTCSFALQILDLATSHTTDVVPGSCSFEASGRWSPDGSRLAYLGEPPGRQPSPTSPPTGVRVVNRDGTNNRLLVADASAGDSFTIDW